MMSSLSKRALAASVVTCSVVATMCGAPSHQFYDDVDGGTPGAGGSLSSGSAGPPGASGRGGGVGVGSGGTAAGGSSNAGGSSGAGGASGSSGGAGKGGGGGGLTDGGSAGTTAGSSGAGGRAGASGAAGSGGAAGAGGTVVGSENCFDNVDNNGNLLVDCADPACASVATCVLEPDNFKLGVLVDKTLNCPAGTTETKVYRGLTGGTTCTGCSCTPKPVTCDADIYAYGTLADCNADTAKTGGALAGHVNAPCTDTNPVMLNSNVVTSGGFRAGIIAVGQSCTGTGTPTVTPAVWTESMKFCSYSSKGGGCAAGKKCVPIQTDPNAQCALNSGSGLCDGFNTSKNDWYTGYSDTRSCGACACTAYGGACQFASVWIGSDYSCAPGSNLTLQSGEKNCTYKYVPNVGLDAQKVNSSCTSSSTLSGSLSPTGQQTMCCSPK